MFQELKVLELASVLAGPSVGQFFAELGAEVIKVENKKTNGDVTRTWKSAREKTDDRSAYFSSVNWGKKSIALDLTLPQDREVVKLLAQRADILISSYKPGDAEKLGVGYVQLANLNPMLIYGQITGYGNDDMRVGYDAVIQAETGFMSMNGEPGGNSLKMPVALIDILAGHQLKEGLLVALLNKGRSGKGSLVQVSLVESAIASLANQGSNFLVNGSVPGKQGSAHPNIAPYGDVFKTSDGKEILLAIGSDKQFVDLCEVLEMPLISEAPEYHTNQARVSHRETLNSILREKIMLMNSSRLMPEFHKRKIPAGIIQDVKMALSSPHAEPLILQNKDRNGLRTFVASVKNYQENSLPFTLEAPPHLDQDRQWVLSQCKEYQKVVKRSSSSN